MKLLLLVIDDEDCMPTLLKSWIGKAIGDVPDVVWRSSYEEGIKEALRQGAGYDAVLLDLNLSNAHRGIETARVFLKKCTLLPVFIMSGIDDFHYVQACIELGAMDYLVKTEDRFLEKAVNIPRLIQYFRMKNLKHVDASGRLLENLKRQTKSLLAQVAN